MWRIPTFCANWMPLEVSKVLVLALCWAKAGGGLASTFPKDSVVVDGSRVTYLAEVDVDTTRDASLFQRDDWWLGVGWDVPVARSISSEDISTLGLVTNRPLLHFEHQSTHPRGRGRWGVFAVYSQPWTLAEEEVSPNVKGWISSSSGLSSPLQQVILVPDSLASERDTVMAPLSPSHALRVGLCWEGVNILGWWPRASVSVDALRPQGWHLLPPSDPSEWPQVQASDTFQKATWWQGRFRLELGGVMDFGNAHGAQRSASQFRASLCWLPGVYGGINLAMLASPSRR